MSGFDAGTDKAWYTKPGFIVAAVLLVVVIVGGVIAIAVNQLRADEPTPSTSAPTSVSPSEASPSATPSAEPDASVCGLSDVEEESSLTAAPDVEWSFVGTVAAPSNDAGPGVVEEDGFRYCYAQTAEGALLSVANYIAITSEPALADRLTELFVDVDDLPTSSEGGYANVRLTIAGYRVLDYNEMQATIDLAVRVNSEQDQLITMPITVFWHEGDWHFTLESLAGAPAPLTSLGGYTPWSPDGS